MSCQLAQTISATLAISSTKCAVLFTEQVTGAVLSPGALFVKICAETQAAVAAPLTGLRLAATLTAVAAASTIATVRAVVQLPLFCWLRFP